MSISIRSRLCLAGASLFAVFWLNTASRAQDHVHADPTAERITINKIVELIASENPTLRAARLHAEALGTVPDQVSSWPDPTFGVAYQPIPMLTAHGPQRSEWMVEQMVPFPGKLALRESIASLDARAAAYDADALLEDAILQAKEAYFELYRLHETEGLIANFEADLQSFEESAAVRYEVGQGSQQALLKAQLEKNRLLQHLHHLAAARRQAAEALARLTNHPEGPHFFLVTEPVLPRMEGLESIALMEAAIDIRPEFAALEAAAERSAYQVELARKEAYPDVGIRVTYHDVAAGDMPNATGRDAVAVGASIKIPLQRGRINAAIEEARIRRDEVAARQEALRTETRTKIEELLAAIHHEAESIDLYESTLLPQATSTVEATLSAYSTGAAGFLDLLDAERTIFSLRSGYVDATARYLTLAARLERVLGVRSLADLERPTAAAPSDIR